MKTSYSYRVSLQTAKYHLHLLARHLGWLPSWEADFLRESMTDAIASKNFAEIRRMKKDAKEHGIHMEKVMFSWWLIRLQLTRFIIR